MTKLTIRLIVLMLGCFFLLNCSNIFNPFKKLEGKWTAGGDQGEGHSWFLEYTFKGNSYSLMGYPPLSESGKMKLKVANDDSLLIGFIVQKSDPQNKNHEEWVYIKGDQLFLNGMSFNRSPEEKKNQ